MLKPVNTVQVFTLGYLYSRFLRYP